MGACSSSEPAVVKKEAPGCVLLGPHGAGKTTLVKQLQLSYNQVNEADRASSLNVLVKRSIMGHLQSWGNHVRDLVAVRPEALSEEVVVIFERLQKVLDGASLESAEDRGAILEVVGMLVDSVDLLRPLTRVGDMSYDPIHLSFLHSALSRLHKEGSEKFKPTDAEIIRLHWHTVGLVEMNVTVGNHTIGVIDTGGRSTERKKWRHLNVEPTTLLIFVVALDSFALTSSLEQESKDADAAENKFLQSLLMFEELAVKDKKLSQLPLVVVLNKSDRLRDVLQHIDTSEDVKKAFDLCFSDFTGEKTEQAVIQRITSEIRRRLPQDKQDTRFLVSSALDDPKDAVLRKALEPILEAKP